MRIFFVFEWFWLWFVTRYNLIREFLKKELIYWESKVLNRYTSLKESNFIKLMMQANKSQRIFSRLSRNKKSFKPISFWTWNQSNFAQHNAEKCFSANKNNRNGFWWEKKTLRFLFLTFFFTNMIINVRIVFF